MTILYLNGDFIPMESATIHPHDCGFSTGIGVFDSMLVQDRVPVYLEDHYERLCHDAKIVIGLDFPLSLTEFETIIQNIIEANASGAPFARIRTTMTGGVVVRPLAAAQTPTILMDGAPCPAPETGKLLCAVISDFPRIAGCILETCKRLDYSRSYAARRKAESLGAHEAILTNTDGTIACGATSNIFIEENDVLITPPLKDGVLAGVTRKNIIKNQGTLEESVSPALLLSADKIYLTNSFYGLREIRLI